MLCLQMGTCYSAYQLAAVFGEGIPMKTASHCFGVMS